VYSHNTMPTLSWLLCKSLVPGVHSSPTTANRRESEMIFLRSSIIRLSKSVINKFLCFVYRASLYNLVNKANFRCFADRASQYIFQYLTKLMQKICFTISSISCLYMFRAHVLETCRGMRHEIELIVKQILCFNLAKY